MDAVKTTAQWFSSYSWTIYHLLQMIKINEITDSLINQELNKCYWRTRFWSRDDFIALYLRIQKKNIPIRRDNRVSGNRVLTVDIHVVALIIHCIRIEFRKCWFLRRGENRSTLRKTSRSRVENQQQTQPTYDAETENRTRATLGGRRVLSPLRHPCSPEIWDLKWLSTKVTPTTSSSLLGG